MKLVNLLILLSLFGCATSSKNLVGETSFHINGGKFDNESWSDELNFKRYSWYQQITQSYDVLYTEVKESSPFWKWFSESEKEKVRSCDHFFIFLTNANRPRMISQSMFYDQMEKNGYDLFFVPDFRSQLINHHDFHESGLDRHRVAGFCSQTTSIDKVVIRLPGFNSVQFTGI